MSARIVGEFGEHALTPDSIARIGSLTACSIVLDGIAGIHLEIRSVRSGFVVVDRGSVQGTYLNGDVRLAANAPVGLNSGDELRVGKHLLRFESEVGRISRIQLPAQSERFVPFDEVPPASLARDYERLRVSHELVLAVADELDGNVRLERILSTLLKLFEAEQGFALLREPSGEFVKRARQPTTGAELDYSRSIVKYVVAEKRAVLIHDAFEQFGGTRSIIANGIRSCMAVPLLFQSDVLGVLLLYSTVGVGVFGEKDLEVLQSAANFAAITLKTSILAEELAQEALVRQQVSRLVAPSLVDQIVRGDLVVERQGATREVSVLFADIRGFTAYSEGRRPDEVVSMLNSYFEAMVEAVFEEEGTLDKFIGDCVMAVFGAPLDQTDHAARALRVARAIQARVEAMAASEVSIGGVEIRVGVGINTGLAVAGFIGSAQALEYTVIGDTVNVASRLCDKASAGDILVGPRTYEYVRDMGRLTPTEPLALKGKAVPLQCFRLAREEG